jgi:hypothetical protein
MDDEERWRQFCAKATPIPEPDPDDPFWQQLRRRWQEQAANDEDDPTIGFSGHFTPLSVWQSDDDEDETSNPPVTGKATREEGAGQ